MECYKADIEYCFRTPGLGGFQMLDLQDFPGQGSALVGILDAFLDSKGIISPEAFSGFCAPVVPLALMDTHCWDSRQTLSIDLAISNYEENDWTQPLKWQLEGKDFKRSGEITSLNIGQGRIEKIGTIETSLSELKEATRLRLTLSTKKYHN